MRKMTSDMIFKPNIRKIEIANLRTFIGANKDGAVAE
jgi:hypothetical protein